MALLIDKSGKICAILVKALLGIFLRYYLNLDLWLRNKCNLNIFLIWNSGCPFVCGSGTICAISAEGIMKNTSVKLFEFGPIFQEMSF